MANSLDRAHKRASELSEESTPAEVQAALKQFRAAWFPDGRTLSPGTIAWMMLDFIPRWIEANHGS